jgi:hypothetical protein
MIGEPPSRFFVPFTALSNDPFLALEPAFKKPNARIPIRRIKMKHISIPTGQSTIALDNLILGRLPKRIVVGMVSEKDMTGHKETSPFNFQPFGLTYLALNVNGDMVPSKPFQPNFTNGQCLREYLSLFEGMEIINSRNGLIISRSDYPEGYTLFVFDLSSDQAPGSDCNGPLRTGTIRLDARFRAALGETINIIILSEYTSAILIDQYRNALPE